MAAVADPEALAAEWDLSPLVDGRGEQGVDAILADAAARTSAFADAYAERVAKLDAAGLTAAMRELGVIRELIQRASVYAQLRLATDTGDEERSRLAQRVKEQTTELETQLVFFGIEWRSLEDEHAERLLEQAGAELDFASQHLRVQRRRGPYTLGPAEERLITQRAVTGQQAWERLFEELAGGVEVELDGEQAPFAVAYNQLSDADADKRRAALDAMDVAMRPGLRTRAYVFNTLLHDKGVEDRLRGYPSWLSSRNIDNQLEDAAVQALIDAVRGRYELAQRWFRVKARLLGKQKLPESDLLAPVFADPTPISYGEARELVVGAYGDFSTEFGQVARRFFDESWIDAPIRPHKMGGAFCETGGPHGHPYVLVNYTGRRYDMSALAHELGHGIHDVLSAPAGVFHQHPPTPIAETASTFGELLLLERLLGAATSDRERLSLLATSVDQSLLTVFIQVFYNQFEQRVHTARQSEGELSTERISQLFRETSNEMAGDALEPHPAMDNFWSMVPHFFLWPGYVYAYAYGNLLSLSLFAHYQRMGSDFVPSFVEFLAAGGSLAPAELGRIVGVDLSDPGFWASGLDLIEVQIRTVEELESSSA